MSEALSPEEVVRIAALARLELSEEEIARYGHDLSAVLDHVARIQALDTTGLRPAAHAIAVRNVFRPDVVAPGLTRDEVLEGAPEVEDGRFKVPRILGEAP